MKNGILNRNDNLTSKILLKITEFPSFMIKEFNQATTIEKCK